MTETTAILSARPFETAHLGGPVYDCVDAKQAHEAVRQGRKAGAFLISCRTSGDGDELATAGFFKVETLVTLERPVTGEVGIPGKVLPVRLAGEEDIADCRLIAAAALRWDRFHADPRIEDAKADALKADWIENDIRGRSDVTLVVEAMDKVAGFCALLLRNDRAVIDLIAVAPDNQGQGIGRSLVVAALNWLRSKAIVLQVGTQAGNPSSLSFYRSMGFQEVQRADTWHWVP